MSSAVDDRCPGTSERAGAQLDLKRAGADTWIVEARGTDSADPPLCVLFGGPKAYERALEFYLQCGRTAQGGDGPAIEAAPAGRPRRGAEAMAALPSGSETGGPGRN